MLDKNKLSSETLKGDDENPPVLKDQSSDILKDTTTPPNTRSISELPADVQEYIKLLRKESETAKKDKADAKKAKEIAEQDKLREQGEYKALAEQHQARISELEPIADRYASLSQLVAAQVEEQIKDWPLEVKTFDPGVEAPIEQRLAWIQKSLPLMERLKTTAKGNVSGPMPSSMKPEERRSTFEDKMRRSGKYGA